SSTRSGSHSVAFTRAYIAAPSHRSFDRVGDVEDDPLHLARPVRSHGIALLGVDGRVLPGEEGVLALPLAQQDVAAGSILIVGRLVAPEKLVRDVSRGSFHARGDLGVSRLKCLLISAVDP